MLFRAVCLFGLGGELEPWPPDGLRPTAADEPILLGPFCTATGIAKDYSASSRGDKDTKRRGRRKKGVMRKGRNGGPFSTRFASNLNRVCGYAHFIM